MIYRIIPSLGWNVSVLGYGGWELGLDGWGNVNPKNCTKILEKAIESGINLIDTAPVYGNGLSEKVIGDVTAGIREKLFIITKCGLVNDGGRIIHSLKRESIQREIESSLNRLKTGYIDIYQIHYPDPATDIEETADVLNELKKSGLIRAIGLCNMDIDNLKKYHSACGAVTLQNRNNYLQPENPAVTEYCAANKIGYIAYSPLAQGLLTDNIGVDYRMFKRDIRRFNNLFNNQTDFRKAINEREKLGRPLSGNAIRFALRSNTTVSCLVSTVNENHLKSNIESINSLNRISDYPGF